MIVIISIYHWEMHVFVRENLMNILRNRVFAQLSIGVGTFEGKSFLVNFIGYILNEICGVDWT